MVKNLMVTATIFTVIFSLSFGGPAHADQDRSAFPYEKVKKFLLKETRFVASPNHINGYHDDGNGKVTLYCTRAAAGNKIIGQILYQFLLLQTESGPRWLYLGNVKSQFID